jgi:hypothetical protein
VCATLYIIDTNCPNISLETALVLRLHACTSHIALNNFSKQLYDLLICNAFADEAHKEGRNCWQIWYVLKNVIFPNLCALDMKLTLQITML